MPMMCKFHLNTDKHTEDDNPTSLSDNKLESDGSVCISMIDFGSHLGFCITPPLITKLMTDAIHAPSRAYSVHTAGLGLANPNPSLRN